MAATESSSMVASCLTWMRLIVGRALALNEDVAVWHAAHSYPMWAIALLDRPRRDTHRSLRPLSLIVERHRKRKWRRSREQKLRLHA
jgi:hypothetical protein